MKEALFYKKLKNNLVQCELCPHKCVIKDNGRGICKVRENKRGALYTLVYGKPCSANAESIQKKPLFHFLPGTYTYSIATVGCNLKCLHCQNWNISQVKPEDTPSLDMPPKEVVKDAIETGCKSIAYTFTEPLIFYEYVLDTAKIAKRHKLKNVLVTNGYINKEPLKKLIPYIDAANVDLKSIKDEFYKKICAASLQPVLDSLKILHKSKVWIEITNLIIPTLNDSQQDIKKLVLWIKNNLGLNVPLHFTAFYPTYKLINLPNTPAKTLELAYNIAKSSKLNYVYLGNIYSEGKENTYCHNCKRLLIERHGFNVLQNNIINNKCKFCKETIPGKF